MLLLSRAEPSTALTFLTRLTTVVFFKVMCMLLLALSPFSQWYKVLSEFNHFSNSLKGRNMISSLLSNMVHNLSLPSIRRLISSCSSSRIENLNLFLMVYFRDRLTRSLSSSSIKSSLEAIWILMRLSWYLH